MQRIDVEIGGAGVMDRADHSFLAQDGQHGACLVAAEQMDLVASGAQGQPGLLQQFLLSMGGNEQGATWRQQRLPGKALRRGIEEGAAGHGERAHLGGAVALGEHGGRSPGRVIAGLRLAFEHDDATMRGEVPGDGSTGNAAADDQEVGFCGQQLAGPR